MKLTDIAAMIPAEYRKEILEMDMVANAHPTSTCNTMHYLATIWKNYIEPTFTGDCNLCYSRVLNNYKQLLPTLIDLEKQAKLMNAV
ncbi:MAG TPA: hypothetical protein PLG68_17155 [Niabella sp.]|nr:hypothetical protein [Niabella sp.]HQX21696.1 hypothetical protein [Niabella sp.]HRB44176.1 hypothetical protein [Niabella sp.]HRB60543.1 hypothetical protein [Niabella sp.]